MTFFSFFIDFCSYLDFSVPGRRFVLHNDNFVHLISFHICSLFSWKAILPTQRYFCPFAFFSFFYCIFSGKAILTTQRCFRQFDLFHLSFDFGFDFGFNICCYFILTLIYVYSGFDFDVDFDVRCDVEIDSVLFLLPVFLFWF